MHTVTIAGEAAEMTVSDSLPEQTHEFLNWALDYWDTRRGARPMPSRGDIDPTDFPQLLATTYLLQRLDDDFKVRVAGTRFREVYGREVTGQCISDLIPLDSGREFHLDVETCCERRHPVYREGRATWRPSGVATRFQRIMLPLAAEGDEIDHLLGFAVFYDEEGRPEV